MDSFVCRNATVLILAVAVGTPVLGRKRRLRSIGGVSATRYRIYHWRRPRAARSTGSGTRPMAPIVRADSIRTSMANG